jgi:hypothetical protein
VRRDDVIKFNYAWSIEFSFLPVSSGIACSWFTYVRAALIRTGL